MLKLALAGVLALCLFDHALADDRVIYGDDDRRDLYAEDVDPRMRELARSTALVVRISDLTPVSDRSFSRLSTRQFSESVGARLCEDERFFSQPVAGHCSGFLAAPDTLVTAGHCLESVPCDATAIVFGYSLEIPDKNLDQIANADIYYCRELVAQILEPCNGNDFAVIKLDRPVQGRRPLAVRQSGSIALGAPLTIIGHPMTLPTKIAGGRSQVRGVPEEAFFVADTDSYGGNSGSAVINSLTYEVEGILVRGEQDLQMDGDCLRSMACEQESCRGEDVTRIGNVLDYIFPPTSGGRVTQQVVAEQNALEQEIPDGDLAGTTIELPVNSQGVVATIGVSLTVQHSYSGDLQVSLVHPDGTSVTLSRLYNRSGQFELAWGTLGALTPTLSSLRDKPAHGSWKLIVRDTSPSDYGTLRAVRLKLEVFQD